jgi:hypothetical protein
MNRNVYLEERLNNVYNFLNLSLIAGLCIMIDITVKILSEDKEIYKLF